MNNKLSRALIITALPVEHAAVVRHLRGGSEDRHRFGNIYWRAEFESWQVLLAEVGAGNATAAQETERAISYFDPDVAVFCGVGGGVKDVALGDVVIANKVYGYESGSDREEFLPRPDVGLSSYPMVQAGRAIAREGKWQQRLLRARPRAESAAPRVFIGAIAAGEKVVKASKGAVATLLRRAYGDALAVEMEGAGFLRAAYATSTEATVVRGISDLLDGKEEADSVGWQEIASENAAAVCFELLRRLASRSADEVARIATTVDAAKGAAPLDEVDPWVRLRELLPRLYPLGPRDKEVWSLAGGDVSRLDLSEDGRTQWARALGLLRKGGGGAISVTNLLNRMLEDYGTSLELQYLRQVLPIV